MFVVSTHAKISQRSQSVRGYSAIHQGPSPSSSHVQYSHCWQPTRLFKLLEP
ncbi:hypothetical protein BD410DRAFT_780632, partial [Rickenella mellea]